MNYEASGLINGNLWKINPYMTGVTSPTERPVSHSLELLGLIPYFMEIGAEGGAMEQLERGYGFPLTEMEGGEVQASLIYMYPGDEPLLPVAFTYFKGSVVVMYPYGIVAINKRDGSPWFVTRMD